MKLINVLTAILYGLLVGIIAIFVISIIVKIVESRHKNED